MGLRGLLEGLGCLLKGLQGLLEWRADLGGGVLVEVLVEFIRGFRIYWEVFPLKRLQESLLFTCL